MLGDQIMNLDSIVDMYCNENADIFTNDYIYLLKDDTQLKLFELINDENEKYLRAYRLFLLKEIKQIECKHLKLALKTGIKIGLEIAKK